MKAEEIIRYMESLRNDEQREVLMRFFKTAPGEYGYGDEFLGLKVPQTREVVKAVANDVSLEEVPQLLMSRWHEVRLCGLLIMVEKFQKLATKRLENDVEAIRRRDEIVKMYLQYAEQANNWDLVDLSAPKILGHWLMLPVQNNGLHGFHELTAEFPVQDNGLHGLHELTAELPIQDNGLHGLHELTAEFPVQDNGLHGFHELTAGSQRQYKQAILDKLAMSDNLWRQRMSMVCTWKTSQMGDASWCLRYAEIHLHHPHDLMHKAVGWMLREMGKRVSMDLLRSFLQQHVHEMPRTMLRYAIEKMDEDERQQWMSNPRHIAL